MPFKDAARKKEYNASYFQNKTEDQRTAAHRTSRLWVERNRQPVNESSVRRNRENPDLRRFSQLKSYYGLSRERFDGMLAEQDGKCAMCSKVFDWSSKETTPHVDHIHDETKRIRGLLCHACNVALGLLKDNITTLQNAVTYLKRFVV